MCAEFPFLIAEKVDILFQVQDYAEAQHLHPSYLSTVIKQKTGKSFNSWIAEKIIAEAQAMLSRSPVSVQEIGNFINGYRKNPLNNRSL